MCEFAMNAIKKELTNNATEEQIINVVDKLCTSILPKTIQQECEAYVNQWGPVVIQLLVRGIDAEKVCTAIQVCTPAKPKMLAMPKVEANIKATPECSLCQYVVEKVDEMLKDNVGQVPTGTFGNEPHAALRMSNRAF